MSKNPVEQLDATLTDADRARLRKIYAPTIIGVPPEDARRSLVVMPDGELRAYGVTDKADVFDNGRQVYLSSRNCGLDWQFVTLPAPVMGAATRLPWSGRWVTVLANATETYALLSDIGPDDPAPQKVTIMPERCVDMFLPAYFLPEKRIMCSGHLKRDGWDVPIVMYSDDDGAHWTTVSLRSTPRHEAVYPHLGVRWQNTGTESTFIRLPDGRLMMLVRTSLDYLYVYYSADLGETWTDGEPSSFHCTITTPYLLRLNDGRTVLFWNNTRPLAERNHETEFPPLDEGARTGVGEDVFTNRDACHVAISDDCVHWCGFRELALNDIRNAPDFRLHGDTLSSADKSIHQFQALELPDGKILVAYGQHEACRRMAIFSIDWLYETEREEAWQNGLANVSTQLYVKSVSGCHLGWGVPGHCAWNRTNGALLIPDPEGNFREVLQLCRVHDERLVSDRQGMVWNFPAAKEGVLTLELRVEGCGVYARLCDHWMNPSDPDVFRYAMYDFALDSRVLTPGVWHVVEIRFDETGCGSVSADGAPLFRIQNRQKDGAPQGISYLHLQTMAQNTDYAGTLVRRMHFHTTKPVCVQTT